jgi:hypothetical protein
MIAEHLSKYPDETYRHLAQRFGLTMGQVIYLVRKAGLCKRDRKEGDLIESGTWVFIPSKQQAGAGK